ncbi:hypothetical protein [Arcicella lustrica]|uniref:Transmembrane protein n=1 Tax=Arcicella lustrica TaxID=2984196 RepID=A0ABU5SJI7_9BACT|nr:hypothetical protein [Arcicella sp. DC25W]MEA5427460.1 hypothetical protein [Arcicella sp. DC25W]
MNDFENVDYQIELNQKRLDEEYSRYNQIISRIGYIMLFYTVYAAYLIQLIQYLISVSSIISWYSFFFLSFILSLALSIYNSIKLLIPVEIAYNEMPKIFYTVLREDYIRQGIAENEVNLYLKESYKIQLEKSVEHNFTVNNKKSNHNYRSIIYCLFGLFPYIICIAFKISSDKDPIQKVELVKSIITDSLIKQQNLIKLKMANEQPNQNAPTNQPPRNEPAKVDPSKVIVRQPVMIKENTNLPTNKGNSNHLPKGTKK